MSKFTLFLVALLLAGWNAFAQDSSQPAPPAATAKAGRMHGDSAEKRLMRMSKRLKLTDEQKEKLRPILQDQEQQMTSVQNDSTLTEPQKRKKMRAVRMASRSQMDDILTPEQKEQMPKMRAGGGGHHRQHGQGSAPSTESDTPQ